MFVVFIIEKFTVFELLQIIYQYNVDKMIY